MDSRMGRTAMDVAARERKPPAHGELRRRARRTAQNDFGGQDVSGKARQGGDFYPNKFAERVTELEVMGRDVEWYGLHD